MPSLQHHTCQIGVVHIQRCHCSKFMLMMSPLQHHTCQIGLIHIRHLHCTKLVLDVATATPHMAGGPEKKNVKEKLYAARHDNRMTPGHRSDWPEGLSAIHSCHTAASSYLRTPLRHHTRQDGLAPKLPYLALCRRNWQSAYQQDGMLTCADSKLTRRHTELLIWHAAG